MNKILLFLFIGSLFCFNILFSQNNYKIYIDSSLSQKEHSQSTPSDSGFYIYSDNGKSYLQIYGSVRLNGAFDINGLQSQPTFSTFDIPTGDENIEKRFIMGPYQTRFGFKSQIKTSLGTFNLKLESDFFGSGENIFRIRHAYGTGYDFLAGQTWSLFGDPGSIPPTVDPDGPNSSLSERTIQIRYQPAEAKISWAIAIESPKPDVTTPDSTQLEPVYQSFPDITSMISLKTRYGYFRISGVFRSISVRNYDESVGTLAGYGGLVSGKYDITKKYKMYFQFTIGKGISRFIKGLQGNGQDVIYDEQNKTNVLLPAYGGFICNSFIWSKIFSSNITAGLLNIINKDFQPGDSFKRSFYFSINSVLIIVKSSRIGIEYDLGKRIDKDGGQGTANRISFIGIMDF